MTERNKKMVSRPHQAAEGSRVYMHQITQHSAMPKASRCELVNQSIQKY
jgi:hypothetical protein